MFWIPLMMAASAAASVGSSLMAGKANKASAQDSAEAARIEAANSRLRGTQIAELSRERLKQTLGAQDAIFAARGLTGNSATAQAFERKTMENALRNEAIDRLGALNQASGADRAAAGYSRQAKFAMPLATLSAAATALDAGVQIGRL